MSAARMIAPATLRLFLIDDHAVVREGLRAVLEDVPEFIVVGEAGSGDEALRSAPALAPDVILIDLMMPGMSAADAIRALKRAHPAAHLLAFTAYAEEALLRDTLQAGATGYLLKDASRHELVTAVKAVAHGRPWLHETLQRQLVELLRRPAPADPFAPLTPRERSVLALVGDGLNNRDIGAQLGLTEGTVKGYVSAVLDKLALMDRTQAALYYHRHRG
jgi:DNA-binding NarL/FixJ family response regulator